MKEVAARRNSTPTGALDALENDVVVETSGSAPSTLTDSMTAVASPALLRERESEKTAVQMMEDILAESQEPLDLSLSQKTPLPPESPGICGMYQAHLPRPWWLSR